MKNKKPKFGTTEFRTSFGFFLDFFKLERGGGVNYKSNYYFSIDCVYC